MVISNQSIMAAINSIVSLIVDCQGFIKNGKFIPREFAFAKIDSEDIVVWDIKSNMEFNNLTCRDKSTNTFITEVLTGLSFKAPTNSIPLDKFKSYLNILYDATKTNTKWAFGLRNHQFKEILEEANIPYVEMLSPSIHNLKTSYTGRYLCDRHTLINDGVCAGKKVELLRKWYHDINSNYVELYN